MKKLAVFMAAGLLMLTACTAKPQNEGQSESKPTMTITTLNGNQERISLEVPADPQRICGSGYGGAGYAGQLGPGRPCCRHAEILNGRLSENV